MPSIILSENKTISSGKVGQMWIIFLMTRSTVYPWGTILSYKFSFQQLFSFSLFLVFVLISSQAAT